MRNLLTGMACGALLLVVGASPARATWIAADDFSITNGNPNGAWSYGWINDTPAFTLNSNHGVSEGCPVWWSTGVNAPLIWRNDTAGTLYGVAPGQLSLCPKGNASVLRWTAPSGFSSQVHVHGQFLVGELIAHSVAILVNGESYWASTSDHGAFDFIYPTSLSAGQTIDFSVYGSDWFGNTPLAATVSAVPEPSALALIGVGIVGLLGWKWRRRR